MKKLPDCDRPQDIESWIEEISDIKQIFQPQEKPAAPLIIKEVKPALREEGLYNHNSFNRLDVGNTDNIDKNTATRFLKGQMDIEARLDLHGYTEKEAFNAVADFLQKSYIRNKRCVMIITGKGLKDDETPWYETKGVIKEALPQWINHADIRPFVLSIAPANREDGGSGAFYILLKRRRSEQIKKP